MTVQLVNLTPHDLVVLEDGVATLSVASTGQFARVLEIRSGARLVNTSAGRTPVTDLSYAADVLGLPPPRAHVIYVVSRITAAAVGRDDVLFPLDEVRDTAGRIVGCRGLGRFRPAATVHHLGGTIAQ